MEKLKILLVDDDVDDRHFFADALESFDSKSVLHQVDNGKSCLEFLEEHANDLPNFIFLDLNMPVMNGFQCLEKIRENENNSTTIIAIYSTSSSEKDIEDTFKLGANIYIKKPLTFKDLKNLLKQVIKNNRKFHFSDFNRDNYLLKISSPIH